MSKPVILTGLRANNDLHIGNYLGAMLPLVDMAKARSKEFQINIFVPDLHSFTTPIDHSKLQERIMHNLNLFVAAGLPLDDPDIHLYRQSYVPAHSELTWILSCFAQIGEMSRMTQFKEKIDSPSLVYGEQPTAAKLRMMQQSELKATVGLFNYPVLMACDILLYGATYVPVGDDQSQHLEFTRDIAERINNKFEQELFVLPESVKKQHEFFGKDQGLRIKDLSDPAKKMSKSDETGKGVLFLGDTPEAAKKKIMSATTDSRGKIAYNYSEQPGIANLIDILALLSGRRLGDVCKQYVGQEQYGPLKQDVAATVAGFLSDFQTKLSKVDKAKLMKKLESSEKDMNIVANKTLLRVQKAIGLR